MYTIGEAAKLLGVSTHTLRYYEKEKIIDPERNSNGDRQYHDSHIKWLRFVMKLKDTQMPLSQIREYARLYQEGEHTSEERLKLLEKQNISIQKQIQNLLSTESMLNQKITAYKEFIMKSKS